MSFVRPEARQAIWRWREVLVALAVLILGAYWTFGTGNLLHLLGYFVMVVGAVLLVTGLQRGRFRGARGGPGVVHVDEGQIAYFGPLTGGAVAMREMTSVAIDPTGKPAHWVLTQPGQADLHVPMTAEGAEALFDAFASLPGIKTEKMLTEMKRDATELVVIWQRGNDARKLH